MRALFQAVNSLSRALEARDPYTAGHQSSVSQLARRIAQQLALSPDRTEGVRVGAVLHDIGKIAIPSEVLTMPRRLHAEEMALIRMHPEHGYNIVCEVDFPWPVAEIVRQHHERADGSGYPNRLSGKDILVEARVVAVADVVNSMVEHRPYRPTLGLAAAQDELIQNRERLYDPDVVDACLAVLAAG